MQASQAGAKLTGTATLLNVDALPHPALAPAGHPLLDELREVAKDSLSSLLSNALAGAGRHFTDRAAQAADESQRRELLDVLQSLRPYTPRIQRSFAVELDRNFSNLASPKVPPPASIPGSIRAHDALWRGLSAQLNELSARLAVPATNGGYAPARIHMALRGALMQAELPQRMMAPLMVLLDQGVMAHLDQVYRRMLERLDLYSLPNAANISLAAANQPRTRGDGGIVTHLQIDSRTETLLSDMARAQDQGPGYSNTQLASEILRSITGPQTEAGVPVTTQALTQRLALVGQLFQTVNEDAHLSQSFKDSFEQLRFAIIKSSISDDSFFGHRVHPLRLLSAELTQLAANAFLGGGDAECQLQLRLQGVTTLFDLSAAFVRPMLTGLRPMSAGVIEHYLADLKDELRERELWRQSRAQLLAVKAIESRTFGNTLPAAINTLLHQDWVSVLARRLLDQGWNSDALRDGLACVDELLDALPASEGKPLALTSALMQKLNAGLRELGMPEEQIRDKLSGMQTGRGAIAAVTPAVPAPPASEIQAASDAVEGRRDRFSLMEKLLRSARWFRVFDHQRKETRWLKLESYYPQQKSIAFVEFDGANPLRMQASQFLDDLLQGRSAPSHADAASNLLLKALQDTPN